jgi:sporulation protein YlmC with PRC-barrel domain
MIIDCKKLIGLPVETKSGLLLGKIKNFEIDSETQTVRQYIVKSRSLMKKLLSEEVSELVVGRSQVISIEEEKMIVEDSVVGETETARLSRSVREDAPALSSRLSVSKINGDFSK